jgi:4-hydroxyphenylpyruvate dioxygenase-like putative hemolysin
MSCHLDPNTLLVKEKGAIMFKRMDHVGVSVENIEKAIAFYRDVVGMEKTMDREVDSPLARIIGIEGCPWNFLPSCSKLLTWVRW